MKTLLAIVLLAFALTVNAQTTNTARLTSSIAWDNQAGAVSWDAILTTINIRVLTNGFMPNASAIIATKTVTGNSVSITNVFPAITNGTYSMFVLGRDVMGQTNPSSTNFVFNMAIPPLPAVNLRLQ